MSSYVRLWHHNGSFIPMENPSMRNLGDLGDSNRSKKHNRDSQNQTLRWLKNIENIMFMWNVSRHWFIINIMVGTWFLMINENCRSWLMLIHLVVSQMFQASRQHLFLVMMWLVNPHKACQPLHSRQRLGKCRNFKQNWRVFPLDSGTQLPTIINSEIKTCPIIHVHIYTYVNFIHVSSLYMSGGAGVFILLKWSQSKLPGVFVASPFMTYFSRICCQNVVSPRIKLVKNPPVYQSPAIPSCDVSPEKRLL